MYGSEFQCFFLKPTIQVKIFEASEGLGCLYFQKWALWNLVGQGMHLMSQVQMQFDLHYNVN